MKKLLIVMLSVLCLFGVVGCKGGEEKPAEKTVIKVWNYYSDHQLEYFKKVIDEFNASQDKYEVVYEGQDKNYLDNIATVTQSGQGPDFLIEYGSYASQWHQDDLVVDLSKYLDRDTIGNLIDSAYTYATDFDDGGMYLYPIIGTGTVVWYIPEILQAAGVEVPETWDEMFAAAKTIHEKVTVKTTDTGLEFVTDGSGKPIYGWTCNTDETLFLVANQAGGCYDIQNKKMTLNNEKVIEWLTKFQQGVKEGYLAPAFDSGYANTDQEAGVTAMGSSSVAGRPYYKLLNPGSTHEFQFDMNDKAHMATIARSRGIIVLNNKNEEKIKGVCEFIKFFTQANYNAKFCEVMNYYAVLKNTLANEDYKKYAAGNEDLEKVMAEYGSYYASVPEASYLKKALKAIVGDVATGKDPKQAIEDAIATFEQQIKG